jgi:hypothetical protein
VASLLAAAASVDRRRMAVRQSTNGHDDHENRGRAPYRGQGVNDLMMPSHSDALNARRSSFRIGEVAKLTDLTTRTLRYWEELGLVRTQARTGTTASVSTRRRM